MTVLDSRRNFLIAGVTVAAAVASFFVQLGPAAKPGLYEHIREGEKHIKAGRYEKGLFCLHKAYEEAPESVAIGERLAEGYLEYARHLKSEGQLELAIEKAATAYEMTPLSLPVINDLSYYLSVRAAERAFQGDFQSAGEDLEIVSILADGSGFVRTNAANYLFNQAINARDIKNTEALMFCLEASYNLRPSFETIVFLGMSFYDEGDLDQAALYWKEALAIKPESEEVRRNLEKTEKEMSLAGKMETFSTPDFDIVVYGAEIGDEELFENTLQEIYKNTGDSLGYFPRPGTRIVIYEEKDFREVFQKSGIIRGFYDGSIRIALPEDASGASQKVILAHEYAHAAVSALTENRSPVWLHEGVALYEQSRYLEPGTARLKEAVKNGQLFTLSEVEGSFGSEEDYDSLALAYEAAYSAVLFILDEWGIGGLKELLEGIREAGHFANAFDERFYTSLTEFEKMWNDFLKKRYFGEDTSYTG